MEILVGSYEICVHLGITKRYNFHIVFDPVAKVYRTTNRCVISVLDHTEGDVYFPPFVKDLISKEIALHSLWLEYKTSYQSIILDYLSNFMINRDIKGKIISSFLPKKYYKEYLVKEMTTKVNISFRSED